MRMCAGPAARRTGARARPAVAVVLVLATAAGLAACGDHRLPRTRANVELCAVLARTLDDESAANREALVTVESSARVSRLLRDDVASYIARSAAQPGSRSAHSATRAPEADCAAIGAPLAKGYGG